MQKQMYLEFPMDCSLNQWEQLVKTFLISYKEELVDATAANLIRNSDDYDVIVTTNMFGDILSDEASEISGSLGLAQSQFWEKLM